MKVVILLLGLAAACSGAVRDKRQYQINSQSPAYYIQQDHPGSYGQGQAYAPTYYPYYPTYNQGYSQSYLPPPAAYNNPLYKVKVPVTYTFTLQQPLQHSASFTPYVGSSNAGTSNANSGATYENAGASSGNTGLVSSDTLYPQAGNYANAENTGSSYIVPAPVESNFAFYGNPGSYGTSGSSGLAYANVGATFPLYAQKPSNYVTDSWDVGALNKSWGSKTKTTGIVEQIGTA